MTVRRQRDFLNYIKRINNIADIGLLYADDDYDIERYEELKEIVIELLHKFTDTSIEKIRAFFPVPNDYPTPKVDVRAFILNEKKEILLVKEKLDGKWSIPGGWADIGLTASEAVEKEVLEESGLHAKAIRLLALFDKKCHPHPPQAPYVYKIIFLCEIIGGKVDKGFDIEEVAFYSPDKLPELSTNRILESQIRKLYLLATK